MQLTAEHVDFIRRQARRLVKNRPAWDWEDAAQEVCEHILAYTGVLPEEENDLKLYLYGTLRHVLISRIRYDNSGTRIPAPAHLETVIRSADLGDQFGGPNASALPESLTSRPNQFETVLLRELCRDAPPELIEEGLTYEPRGKLPKTGIPRTRAKLPGTPMERCLRRKALRATYQEDYSL